MEKKDLKVTADALGRKLRETNTPKKINPGSYFRQAVGRIEREKRRDTINIAYANAEELLREMYEEKGNIPIPPGWKVSNKVLDNWAQEEIQSGEINQAEVQIYCDAFEQRFSQGYPNNVM